MSGAGMRIAVFGSSLVSAYWNGAATYYRGVLKALAVRGHRIVFYEPDAYGRQQHRDIADPPWARVVVYRPEEAAVMAALEAAGDCELALKCSGVGVFDALLEREILGLRAPHRLVGFWDVDAPATLARVRDDPQEPFRQLIARYDLILTYGGGERVRRGYLELGARHCEAVYNALDPTSHFRVMPTRRFAADLALLANRLPDREARIERFFFEPARQLKHLRCVLGGNGWEDKPMPDNVRYLGHVYTTEHNAFNSSVGVVLNVNRESMAQLGFSPPTRIFEAAGAAACIVTDRWPGVEQFLEPEREVLVAGEGAEVCAQLQGLTPKRARAIGLAAARRILAQHTYEHRAAQIEALLGGRMGAKPQGGAGCES